jgi:predicted Rossmann-fold nucleotide-binding protein
LAITTLPRPIPVLLYGAKYWNEVVDFEAFVKHGTISESDLSLFRMVDDPQEALRHLQEIVPESVEPEPTGFARSVTRRRLEGTCQKSSPQQKGN